MTKAKPKSSSVDLISAAMRHISVAMTHGVNHQESLVKAVERHGDRIAGAFERIADSVERNLDGGGISRSDAQAWADALGHAVQAGDPDALERLGKDFQRALLNMHGPTAEGVAEQFEQVTGLKARVDE